MKAWSWEKNLCEIFKNINSNLQAASIQVTNENIRKEYETLVQKMLDLIKK